MPRCRRNSGKFVKFIHPSSKCNRNALWMQLIMFVLRLGIISSLLSETLVSGFTTGAAIHVFTSQVKDLLGIKLTPTVGNFKVILVSVSHEIPPSP